MEGDYVVYPAQDFGQRGEKCPACGCMSVIRASLQCWCLNCGWKNYISDAEHERALLRLRRLEAIRREWKKERCELNKVKTPMWRLGSALAEDRERRALKLIEEATDEDSL